jgi:hypothetical protein
MTMHTRREFLKTAGLGVCSAAAMSAGLNTATVGQAAEPKKAKAFQVGAYYFPNYHVDPRNEKAHGRSWTEWELVKKAQPRFAGHVQPKVPAWGYQDEADPKVMQQKIDVAADHGLDYWIFDWYWYNDGPFIDRCLEQGYLNAPNNQRVKFCCMWANHDWINIHPAKRGAPKPLLYPGAVTPKTFDTIVDHVINRYFKHPAHWTVNGCPYFSIYELSKLLQSFGSVGATREALAEFRRKTKAAGFPDLHLNAVVWGRPILPGEKTPAQPEKLVPELGFDSITSYVWIHHVPLNKLETDYRQVQEQYFKYWGETETKFKLPYYPNVSMGWDPSPRTVQTDEYGNFGYPFTNTISGNTPERFRDALLAVRRRLEESPSRPRILNLNAWNEWTEGSYLEPDTVNGLGYLQAIREVFG